MRDNRRTAVRRGIALLLTLVLLLGAAAACAEKSAYRTLKQGNKGSAVLRLKDRLHELGYILFDGYSNRFEGVTREAVIALQQDNGLKADGIATAALQEFIFSDECLPKATLVSSGTMPPPAGDDPPLLDSDGYLAEGDTPYCYASRKEGAWSYVSRDVRIEIRQYSDEDIPRIWLEASIRVRDPALFTSIVNQGSKPGSKALILRRPDTMARNSGAIFAISDDFFGYRISNKQTLGIVIRNGFVWSAKTRGAAAKVWPPLDVMAFFADGSMKTYVSDEHTAEEYLDMGVVTTLAFGPILVQDGVICQDVKNWNVTDRQPRMAIGITADGTIRVLDVLGRRKGSIGASIPWVAERMALMGCVEALNLDGGNTTAMIFNGDMINREANVKAKDIRSVNAMMGVIPPAEDPEAGE